MSSFSKLKKELDEGKKREFYVFVGEEKELIRRYIKRVDEKAITLDTLEQFMTRITNTGLFAEKSTFVLKDNEEIQKVDIEKIVKRLRGNKLILVYSEIDRRKKFFKDVADYIVEFNKFTDNQLIAYIQKQLPISSELAYIIAKVCDNDIGRIEIEIHKLQHVGKDITIELLEDLLTAPAEDRIFEMIDSVASKNKQRAFDIYNDLIQLGESPIKIISLLYTKFKQLFLVQSYYSLPEHEIVNKTGLKYGQVMFTKKLVGAFSTGRLLSILKDIQKTEVAVKTGKEDINLATEMLILRIFQ